MIDFVRKSELVGRHLSYAKITSLACTIPRSVILISFFIARPPELKCLRWRDLGLNVFRLIKASGASLGAVSRAVRLPAAGSNHPFRNLNFSKGNF